MTEFQNTFGYILESWTVSYRRWKSILKTFSNRIVVFAGNGYISTDTLKEILKELDSKLTNEDLENIIEEVDEDGSGTLDFDEFMEMMAG